MHYPRGQGRLFVWRKRRCVCGLRWPCPDSLVQRAQIRYAAADRTAAWGTSPTAPYPQQVGRVGRLTPGQERRANGGRR